MPINNRMIRALPGSSLSLECSLRNEDKNLPYLEWRRSDNELMSQDPVFEIESVETSHSGKYFCSHNDTFRSEFIDVKVGKEKPYEISLDLNETDTTLEWTTALSTEQANTILTSIEDSTPSETTEVTTITTTTSKSRPKTKIINTQTRKTITFE